MPFSRLIRDLRHGLLGLEEAVQVRTFVTEVKASSGLSWYVNRLTPTLSRVDANRSMTGSCSVGRANGGMIPYGWCMRHTVSYSAPLLSD